MIWQPDRPTVRSYRAVTLRTGDSRTTDAWCACATAASAVRPVRWPGYTSKLIQGRIHLRTGRRLPDVLTAPLRLEATKRVFRIQQVTHVCLDLIRVFPGLHPADDFLHTRAKMRAHSLRELAHHARCLARIILVQPFRFGGERLHGPLHAAFVHVRHAVVALGLLSSLGNGKPRYLPLQLGPAAPWALRALFCVHPPGEKVEDGVTIGTVKFVYWHKIGRAHV